MRLPLPGQATTTPETRLECGLAVQKRIVGGEWVDAMYDDAPDDEQHLQRYLSANCFGDHLTRDGAAIRLRAGDTVWTPAGEQHWHGGTADNMMCHYAILDETPAGDATTWLEPVTDGQYAAAHSAA